jgi:hypothetical protein
MVRGRRPPSQTWRTSLQNHAEAIAASDRRVVSTLTRARAGGLTDIVAIARGAGVSRSEWVRDEANFDALIERRFEEGGPLLLAAKIDDQPGKGRQAREPPLIRRRFMGIGNEPQRCAGWFATADVVIEWLLRRTLCQLVALSGHHADNVCFGT